MLINLTNHPYKLWPEEQKTAASQYGEVFEMPFPQVDSKSDINEVTLLVKEYLNKILPLNPNAVLCQGEMTFTTLMVVSLNYHGIKTVAACSSRVTKETVREDGTVEKTAIFQFDGFREYSCNPVKLK